MRLSVEHVTQAFGSITLFQDLSFTAAPQTITALIGPSGSGKSTLLSIIAKNLAPTSGTVSYSDIDVTTWIHQIPVGVEHQTILQQTAFPLLFQGYSAAEAFDEAADLLGQFDLASKATRRFKVLSGGEIARFMCARALAMHPDLILVDEPTAQLDRASAEKLVETFIVLKKTNVITIIATHDPFVVEMSDQQVAL